MSDAVLAYLFLALCGNIVVWIVLYRGIRAQLRARHSGRHDAIFGGGARRRNGMDGFFGLLGFVLREDHAALGDGGLFVRCLMLKLCSGLFFVIFLAMMFAPFFIRLQP